MIVSLSSHRKLVRSLVLIMGVVGFGTAGYMLLEGWSAMDALFMTIITMSTIGYGEVHKLTPKGQLFTIGIIVLSIGLAGYALSGLGAFIMEGEFKRFLRERRMEKDISKLTDHIILCGLGRVGLRIAEELSRAGMSFVVIEQDDAALQEVAEQEHILFLHGDATRDETLIRAGIKSASGLMTTLREDKDNVFVVLCARSLNPKLFIVARVIEEKNEPLLRKAGADRIVSPDAIGGLRMASLMLRPKVIAFFDEMLRVTGQLLRIEEVDIDEYPALQNRSLGAVNIRKRTGALVLAIKSGNDAYQFNPGANTELRPGDVLIVVGTDQQIASQRWTAEYGQINQG
ncbi:K+ transport systems, NAD-binding component [Candidatus Moduliflexus flocculans]|uniref:K+ transport systems, NAD-binding component n=1 Tax=Candidatus Moduliflexus flocculans TaxID=1499966 RepID=A0A0S6VW79_9BACT|nr:K+ transport systems, NAD-binding component [Candidatus Moduliflexus flocculans]